MKGEDFAYPGLAQPQKDDEKIYHAYYQWVPFVLLLQGMLFYFPHWLWKTLEDRKLDKITNGLRGTIFLVAFIHMQALSVTVTVLGIHKQLSL